VADTRSSLFRCLAAEFFDHGNQTHNALPKFIGRNKFTGFVRYGHIAWPKYH
jgi:hypothetical protein